MGRVAVFYAVPARIFLQYRKWLHLEQCAIMFQISLTEHTFVFLLQIGKPAMEAYDSL